MGFSQEEILQLESKSGVLKWSITSDDSVEIVSLYDVERTNRRIVQCQSSVCNMRKGSKRNIVTLADATELCPHLKSFQKYFVDNLDEFAGSKNSSTDSFLPDAKVSLIIKTFTKVLLSVLFTSYYLLLLSLF